MNPYSCSLCVLVFQGYFTNEHMKTFPFVNLKTVSRDIKYTSTILQKRVGKHVAIKGLEEALMGDGRMTNHVIEHLQLIVKEEEVVMI